MKQQGYYRFPTLHNDTVLFVCEDDLWSVSANGGLARRLTSNLAEITRPILSPDGMRVTFTGREDGNVEVYCMNSFGGLEKRLTYLGANTRTVGWSNEGHIIFSTNAEQPFAARMMLHSIHPEGGETTPLNYGVAHSIAFGGNGRVLLGRNTLDPATWKRYRGGTAGVFWIDRIGNGVFEKLLSDVNGNLTAPMWIGERIYFVSDHEGIGNIYSCNIDGKDISAHTSSKDYYVRHAQTDGKRIVYQLAGELYIYNPTTEQNEKIDIEFYSPQTQRQRKFVQASQYLHEVALHSEGHYLIATTRGKPFVFGNWDGPIHQIGKHDGVRYRLTTWRNNEKDYITISDEGGEERLEIHGSDFDSNITRFDDLDIGLAREMQVSPKNDVVAISNHRFELLLIDLTEGTLKVLDKSEFSTIGGLNWSSDGKWLAYHCATTNQTSSIKVCNVENSETFLITPPRFRDYMPSFDPEGKYLYFISYREFNPVYDSMYFDLNFPRGMRPYLIALTKEVGSPFITLPVSDAKTKKNATEKEDEKTNKEVIIDFNGIEGRVTAFPVPEARYTGIFGLKGKVLFGSLPIRGSLDVPLQGDSVNEAGVLEIYDFDAQKREQIAHNVNGYIVSRNCEVLAYQSGTRVRVLNIKTLGKDKDHNDSSPGRRTGWIDLSRIKLSVEPIAEWRQMFNEVWRLQREHFWTKDMSGIDWNNMKQRYAPLIERVASRSEYSDIIWELLGELATSHAYERGGDYRLPPTYRQGLLGASFRYVEEENGYRISDMVQGDTWNDKLTSPLRRLGTNIEEGDILLAVNGKRVSVHCSPMELLVNQANSDVNLTVKSAKTGENRTVGVRALSNETQARYRDWVEQNRKKVHELSNNCVGYVHVPNMGPVGYAEFHRYYLTEVEKNSLIVDVRFNGGGHVSQLLLEKLARKRLAYTVKRWGIPDPYPRDSVAGRLVALTNEYAGSDGDIFSHSFKNMGLGLLIGKRTWGGVIGISPKYILADGSMTTQPEFSFWFTDVGFKVENYGTDPDIVVDIAPQDYRKGEDPQLLAAIDEIMKMMNQSPFEMPNFDDRPKLNV